MSKKKPNNKNSKAAGGWGALKSCGKQLLFSGKPLSGAKTMLKANQPGGFDCPGCAWGDPEHGSSFEFCENGLKAVAWEATSSRVTGKFLAKHTVSELREWSAYKLEHQGRLTEPMRYNAMTDHYEIVDWNTAFEEIGASLNTLDSPNQAEFYTSGRASNEAAFLYQMFVRLYGTNNFPDCSNMCHEASGVALTDAIGIGKGTVLLEDFEKADAIFVVGQNPGTNHPRMLSDLRKATERGARVVVFNTLKEKGLQRFADPQKKIEMFTGGSKATSTDYFRPRLGGDMAIFRGMAKIVFETEDAAQASGKQPTLDHEFINEHCEGFESYRKLALETPWDLIENQSGMSKAEITKAAEIYIASHSVICTWAMGITQHRHSVATIREITNFMLLRGNVGRPGAGLCPVRGHSNVQGDRTVGINEKPSQKFLDALEKELGTKMPRQNGHNVLAAIGAMLDGSARAFIALGGNFARAVPDSQLISDAMQKLDLTVNIATKLNHGHLLPGKISYVLPCLGRTEIDRNTAGERQLVTVEDSMSMVHSSGGINLPASKQLKSEVSIIAGIANATLGNKAVDWILLSENNDLIRDMIGRVLPIFDGYNERIRAPRGFYLNNGAAKRQWDTKTAKANFSQDDLPKKTEWQSAQNDAQVFILQTFRSHDQYNTTVYGMDDRYRGVYGEREVVFINAEDLSELGIENNTRADVIGLHDDGVERIARNFRLVAYDIPRGCVGGYYPELNVLVPHSNFGDKSYTPTSKSIKVKFNVCGHDTNT